MNCSLYVVTDEKLSSGKSHVEIARAAVAGGADIIQLRDKEMDHAEFVKTACDIRDVCKDKAIFIVNDNLEAALEAKADGVHLGQSDMPICEARKRVPAGFIIGISVGSVEEARKGIEDGADYIAVSPVFDTNSKIDAGCGHGIKTIQDIRRTFPDTTIIGIGGINESNVAEVMNAGLDGIAVISAVVCKPDIEAATRNLRAMVEETKQRGEQWCAKIPLGEGEAIRRKLIAEGLIDRNFRPRAENGFLLLPVLNEIDGAVRAKFTTAKVHEEFARHEQIGGIVILQDDNQAEAERILKARPNVHTALFATSPVEGEFRTKTFKVLAGIPTTETIYSEYGHRMSIDLTAAYFSARLSNERQRIFTQMNDNEVILDMFAGVGPFPVILGKKAKMMICNDLNPEAIRLMQRNLRMNHLKNVLPMLGDAKNLPDVLDSMKFDRIIMNLPFAAYEFLEAAARLAKPGAKIHLYSLVEHEGEHMEDILRAFPNARVLEKNIRSYSPTSWHAVYDIDVPEKSDKGQNDLTI